MKLLDLFCGAGGAAMGYYRAGFKDITGIDNRPMPRYPFKFIQADALEYLKDHGQEYDVIHASPPCQAHSITKLIHGKEYPDLVGTTRDLLISVGKSYVIENVEGAPLKNYVKLCGSMFGLPIYRHRKFECEPPLYFAPFTCNHKYKTPPRGQYNSLKNSMIITCVGNNFEADSGREAMGINWMTRAELAQAIPPAYTEWIGKRILEAINANLP